MPNDANSCRQRHFGNSPDVLCRVSPLHSRIADHYYRIYFHRQSNTVRALNQRPQDTSILVVAEHALVRAGLRALLGGTPGLSVIAEAPDLQNAATLAQRYQPDVVLLDIAPADAERSADALGRAAPRACVLYLGEGNGDVGMLRCIPRDAGVNEFCDAVASVLGNRCGACGLRPACRAVTAAISLSPRERQVAVYVAAGLASKQIAALLGIGLRTVNTYRESLARKLGASSPAVLTRYVLEHGLDPDSHALRTASR